MYKKAFLIRGFRFGTSAADPDFEIVREAVRQCGYEVVPVPWTWNFKTMSEYTDKFVDFYIKNKGEYNIVIGHSFGAMVALASASRTRPDLLVLCSLSGYFKEDLPKYTKALLLKSPDLVIKRIGKRRRLDFEKLSAVEMPEEVRRLGIKTALLYGEQEKTTFPVLFDRVKQTASIIKQAKLTEIPDADHSIRGATYLAALKGALK